MNFSQSVFRPRFHIYLQHHLRRTQISDRAHIWELVATDPDRVQREVERAYLNTFEDVPAGGLAKRNYAISDFFDWLKDNWRLILQLLLSLLLILDEETDEQV